LELEDTTPKLLASKNSKLVGTPSDFAIELSLPKIPQVYSDLEGDIQNIKKLDS